MSDPVAEHVKQFALPHGLAGRLVGWLMAVGNVDMERAAVATLAPAANESVLEIGFGPGVGLRRIARRTSGFVAGVDPSEVMLSQATRRNRAAMHARRMELRRSTASQLPWEDGTFDAIVSVNNIQEWPTLRGDMAEIRRVLEDRGRLVIAVHAWVAKYAKDRGEPDRPWAEHIVEALTLAGFDDTTTREARARSGRALYFTARRKT